jgi:crotonobetainyl-CoA:carnitine CoA-transferase CaiB-like acyl-CoA transferase
MVHVIDGVLDEQSEHDWGSGDLAESHNVFMSKPVGNGPTSEHSQQEGTLAELVAHPISAQIAAIDQTAQQVTCGADWCIDIASNATEAESAPTRYHLEDVVNPPYGAVSRRIAIRHFRSLRKYATGGEARLAPGKPDSMDMAHDIAEALTERLNDGVTTRSSVTIVGRDPVTPSMHRVGDASAAAIAAFGQQVAGVLEDAGGAPQHVTVDVLHAIDQLRAPFLARINGVPAAQVVDDPAAITNSDFYLARDGRWIFVVTTYPHQHAAVCLVLNCPPIKERIAEAARHWDAFALEDAICAAGGACAVVRSAEEWSASAPGRHIAGRPVVRIERCGDAPARRMPPADQRGPLTGLRVLDNTHVFAGPVAARLLATFGAEALHTSRPDRPDMNAMIVLTGGGKRNAFCDIRDPRQADALRAVLAGADIFVNSYRGMSEKGFGIEDLVAARPGIVNLDYHCWGSDGPWGSRGGFDQLACSATGFAQVEGVDRPALPPTYLLNDYLAAYLGAAGALAARRRQATEGGSWRVSVDLARVCTWVQELGCFDRAAIEGIPPPGAPSIPMVTVRGPFGRVSEPALPMTFSTIKIPQIGAATPLGSSELEWQL